MELYNNVNILNVKVKPNYPAIAAWHYATSIDLNTDFKWASGQADNAGAPAVQKAVQGTSCTAMKPERENAENSRV